APLEHLERHTDRLAATHREAGALRDPLETVTGEEANVTDVEDAAAVVVEAAERDSRPRVPVADVRNAPDHSSLRTQELLALLEQSPRIADVFEHVRREDHVEAVADFGRDTTVEIGFEETVDPLTDALALV